MILCKDLFAILITQLVLWSVSCSLYQNINAMVENQTAMPSDEVTTVKDTVREVKTTVDTNPSDAQSIQGNDNILQQSNNDTSLLDVFKTADEDENWKRNNQTEKDSSNQIDSEMRSVSSDENNRNGRRVMINNGINKIINSKKSNLLKYRMGLIDNAYDVKHKLQLRRNEKRSQFSVSNMKANYFNSFKNDPLGKSVLRFRQRTPLLKVEGNINNMKRGKHNTLNSTNNDVSIHSITTKSRVNDYQKSQVENRENSENIQKYIKRKEVSNTLPEHYKNDTHFVTSARENRREDTNIFNFDEHFDNSSLGILNLENSNLEDPVKEESAQNKLFTVDADDKSSGRGRQKKSTMGAIAEKLKSIFPFLKNLGVKKVQSNFKKSKTANGHPDQGSFEYDPRFGMLYVPKDSPITMSHHMKYAKPYVHPSPESYNAPLLTGSKTPFSYYGPESSTKTKIRGIPVPYHVEVEKKVPFFVKVPYDNPVPIHIPQPYGVPVEKIIPYPVRVEVPEPYPVTRLVKQPYNLYVENPVPVEVERPYTLIKEKLKPYTVETMVPKPYLHFAYNNYPVNLSYDKVVPVAVDEQNNLFRDDLEKYNFKNLHHIEESASNDLMLSQSKNYNKMKLKQFSHQIPGHAIVSHGDLTGAHYKYPTHNFYDGKYKLASSFVTRAPKHTRLSHHTHVSNQGTEDERKNPGITEVKFLDLMRETQQQEIIKQSELLSEAFKHNQLHEQHMRELHEQNQLLKENLKLAQEKLRMIPQYQGSKSTKEEYPDFKPLRSNLHLAVLMKDKYNLHKFNEQYVSQIPQPSNVNDNIQYPMNLPNNQGSSTYNNNNGVEIIKSEDKNSFNTNSKVQNSDKFYKNSNNNDGTEVIRSEAYTYNLHDGKPLSSFYNPVNDSAVSFTHQINSQANPENSNSNLYRLQLEYRILENLMQSVKEKKETSNANTEMKKEIRSPSPEVHLPFKPPVHPPNYAAHQQESESILSGVNKYVQKGNNIELQKEISSPNNKNINVASSYVVANKDIAPPNLAPKGDHNHTRQLTSVIEDIYFSNSSMSPNYQQLYDNSILFSVANGYAYNNKGPMTKNMNDNLNERPKLKNSITLSVRSPEKNSAKLNENFFTNFDKTNFNNGIGDFSIKNNNKVIRNSPYHHIPTVVDHLDTLKESNASQSEKNVLGKPTTLREYVDRNLKQANKVKDVHVVYANKLNYSSSDHFNTGSHANKLISNNYNYDNRNGNEFSGKKNVPEIFKIGYDDAIKPKVRLKDIEADNFNLVPKGISDFSFKRPSYSQDEGDINDSYYHSKRNYKNIREKTNLNYTDDVRSNKKINYGNMDQFLTIVRNTVPKKDSLDILPESSSEFNYTSASPSHDEGDLSRSNYKSDQTEIREKINSAYTEEYGKNKIINYGKLDDFLTRASYTTPKTAANLNNVILDDIQKHFDSEPYIKSNSSASTNFDFLKTEMSNISDEDLELPEYNKNEQPNSSIPVKTDLNEINTYEKQHPVYFQRDKAYVKIVNHTKDNIVSKTRKNAQQIRNQELRPNESKSIADNPSNILLGTLESEHEETKIPNGSNKIDKTDTNNGAGGKKNETISTDFNQFVKYDERIKDPDFFLKEKEYGRTLNHSKDNIPTKTRKNDQQSKGQLLESLNKSKNITDTLNVETVEIQKERAETVNKSTEKVDKTDFNIEYERLNSSDPAHSIRKKIELENSKELEIDTAYFVSAESSQSPVDALTKAVTNQSNFTNEMKTEMPLFTIPPYTEGNKTNIDQLQEHIARNNITSFSPDPLKNLTRSVKRQSLRNRGSIKAFGTNNDTDVHPTDDDVAVVKMPREPTRKFSRRRRPDHNLRSKKSLTFENNTVIQNQTRHDVVNRTTADKSSSEPSKQNRIGSRALKIEKEINVPSDFDRKEKDTKNINELATDIKKSDKNTSETATNKISVKVESKVNDTTHDSESTTPVSQAKAVKVRTTQQNERIKIQNFIKEKIETSKLSKHSRSYNHKNSSDLLERRLKYRDKFLANVNATSTTEATI